MASLDLGRIAAVAFLALAPGSDCSPPPHPGTTCEETVYALERCIQLNDPNCSVGLIDPRQRHEFGFKSLQRVATSVWTGWEGFHWTSLRPRQKGTTCYVSATIAGHHVAGGWPYLEDVVSNLGVYQVDDRWYVSVPGAHCTPDHSWCDPG
jgi:hypothetical protein